MNLNTILDENEEEQLEPVVPAGTIFQESGPEFEEEAGKEAREGHGWESFKENLLLPRPDSPIWGAPNADIANMITEIIRPVMTSIGKMLENNTAALEQLSSAQAIQNDRLEALEKQIRLQTPVSRKQAGYLKDAIRRKSRELLDESGLSDDKKAVTKLAGMIRKAVLSRYGKEDIQEIPKHEYNVAMGQIEMWSNRMAVRDVVKEARARAESGGGAA